MNMFFSSPVLLFLVHDVLNAPVRHEQAVFDAVITAVFNRSRIFPVDRVAVVGMNCIQKAS
jgi:hypothetical protein